MDDWRTDLQEVIQERDSIEQAANGEKIDQAFEAAVYLERTVLVAFEEVKAELEKAGRTVTITRGTSDLPNHWEGDKLTINAEHNEQLELMYVMVVRRSPNGSSLDEIDLRLQNANPYDPSNPFLAARVKGNGLGTQPSKDDIARALVENYRLWYEETKRLENDRKRT